MPCHRTVHAFQDFGQDLPEKTRIRRNRTQRTTDSTLLGRPIFFGSGTSFPWWIAIQRNATQRNCLKSDDFAINVRALFRINQYRIKDRTNDIYILTTLCNPTAY
mmetsp:Transcript_26325/g.55323  ORF Transcript_26325/g.55323 Transcript_26325/m.55323 type:complete len:105 (-) Transcript_26325:47-361(-)